MAGPSTSHALTELDQVQALNAVLNNENTGEFNLDDDSVLHSNYTQLVIAGTHVYSNCESGNGSDEQEEENKHMSASPSNTGGCTKDPGEV
jgi:hypothetical protein